MRGLAFVGNQPSALAVAVKSFDAAWPQVLHELQLLATPHVGEVTTRLRAYFARALPHISVPEPRLVAARVPAPPGGLPAADAVARTWLQSGANEPVVFFADPGLKTPSVAAASVLPADTRFVHADPLAVYVRRMEAGREVVDRLAARDLGFDTLLELFDIRRQPGATPVSADLRARITSSERGDDFVTGITLEARGGSLPLQAAYEKGGWLYGLVELDPRGSPTVDQMREVHASRRALWPLQPTLAVRSRDSFAQHRSESEQLEVVEGGPVSSLAMWLAKGAQPPLYVRIGRASHEIETSSARGAGGGDSSLVVCVGPDPSATLNSIYTHGPATAFLFFDETTPLVRAKAAILRELAGEMPAGEVQLVPSDTLGSGIAEYVAARCPRGRIIADITPARVSQALAMTHLPGVEIWQQEGDAGSASRLDGSGRTDLVGARLDVQAHAVGGSLRQAGESVSWSAEDQQFFAVLVRLLAVGRAENPALVLSPLPAFRCAAGDVRTNGARVTVRGEGLTLSFAGWRRGIRGGYWFEELVANRLFAAGVAEDARIGLAWSWPPEVQAQVERKVRESDKRKRPSRDEDVFRDEVDVAIRLGHRFCAVSCKTDPREDLERAAAHIGAVAETGFGRFCLVALAHPGPISADERQAIARVGRNIVIIDLPLLADGQALAEAVRSGWGRLGTRD